jgi:hypothetical protein
MYTVHMAEKLPTAARFFYFHVDNNEEIKNLWSELAKRTGIEIEEKDTGKLIKESFKKHGLTNVKTVQGSKASLSISLYKNIVIVSGLFTVSGSLRKIVDEVGFKDISGIDVAIGGATILIAKEWEDEKLEQELGKKFTRIETKIGSLCQFEEKVGRKEHLYLLTSSPSLKDLEHFLTLDFPLFDFAIHKLHVERDYYKNQQKWIMNEKEEIDKSVGDMLHKGIVGETLNPQFIETLEKDIDALSSKYAILVNDAHSIKKARIAIEDDVEMVYAHLKDFAKLPPDGLDILKNSMALKEKLLDAETSLSHAIKNTKTAIDTVRTSVDLLRSRENIFLQEEAVSIQVAAGVLEFIIIFYYSLTSWLHIIGEERFESIPPAIRFILIFIFSSFAVALTHYIGKSYREKWKLNKGMVITWVGLLVVFLYIVHLSIQTGLLHPT